MTLQELRAKWVNGGELTENDIHELFEIAMKASVWIKDNVPVDMAAEMDKAVETACFYADPETYLAIGFFPDPPAGEFMDDFSETDYGRKPGRRAREFLQMRFGH